MFAETGAGARICFEAIGDSGAPALLLIGGAAWSMDWWEDGFCRELADRGRLVVRYDYRDTGRSTSYPAGSPGYTATDMITDPLAVLDTLEIDRAHVAGLSMGGALAITLALDHRDRVASLTPMSTSSVGPGQDGLPGMAPELAGGPPAPDWSDRAAVVDYVVAEARPYSGDYDEPRVRAVAERVVARTEDVEAGFTNHMLVEGGEEIRHRLGELAGLPTLVLHGAADPLFPLPHGEALAREIPGARLVVLEGVGHELAPPRLWGMVADLLAEHTEPL